MIIFKLKINQKKAAIILSAIDFVPIASMVTMQPDISHNSGNAVISFGFRADLRFVPRPTVFTWPCTDHVRLLAEMLCHMTSVSFTLWRLLLHNFQPTIAPTARKHCSNFGVDFLEYSSKRISWDSEWSSRNVDNHFFFIESILQYLPNLVPLLWHCQSQ